MNQTMIYDFLGLDTDPLWNKLKSLEKGQRIIFEMFSVSLNSSGIYEVSSEESHDGFSNIKDCYKCLIKEL